MLKTIWQGVIQMIYINLSPKKLVHKYYHDKLKPTADGLLLFFSDIWFQPE